VVVGGGGSVRVGGRWREVVLGLGVWFSGVEWRAGSWDTMLWGFDVGGVG
jgi:hypothetical protein